jgi:nucleoside-diphosphate-sugar epimerase
VRRRIPDMTKSEALLGFKPTIGVREGLTRLWDWYRSPAGVAEAALARSAE